MVVAAAEFNTVFDEVVAESLITIGAWQRGRRLFYSDDVLAVALLRVEHRWKPPAQLQLAVRHRMLHTMDDETPLEPPTNPFEYPIRVRPSEADALLSPDWQYTSVIGQRGPTDSIAYPTMAVDECRAVLAPIGAALTETLPRLSQHLSVDRVLNSIEMYGSDTWIEQRWIADLQASLRRGAEGRDG